MKLYGKTNVLVPYFDSESMKQWKNLGFTPPEGEGMDKRRLIAAVILYIKRAFNKTVSKGWVLKNCPILNKNNPLLEISHGQAYAAWLEAASEAWIQRMGSYDEDEVSGDTAGETTDAGTAESHLPAVQEGPEGQ